MKYLRHLPALLLFTVGAVLLNYYLPDRDVVQIVGTEVKRIDVGSSAPFWDRADIGTVEGGTRDVRFINARTETGRARVYRNEDTGWGFPPYFKFDSGDLTADAQSLAREDDTWVAVRHYGWRIKMFSVYPNATSFRRVTGPDAMLIPWFNIVFIGLLLGLWFTIWRSVRRWKAKRIDPTLDAVGDSIGDAAREVGRSVDAGTDRVQSRWRKIFGSSKPRR
ncbi:DUF1523 family protein [uncultured Algimonas sp.]|uniref:DUF1523 family protein n=1 Tax=uncultured Algimonas sp. TaxID=1547920 RepID=UPI00263701CC|nr:DUF1523 family protein [uncultured Algimonas sp.]